VSVLIHSPLLGPASWSLVAQELARRGHEAIVPSLLGIGSAPEPQWHYALSAVRAMTVGISSPIVLVGHSAAGPLLPAIAHAVAPELAGIIFVDCDLPPTEGTAPLAPGPLTEQLRALADDSLLPRSSWFRQQVAEGLIPPQSPAAALVEEIPALPLSYLTSCVPMPQAWTTCPCAYVLLSPGAHAESAIRAHARDWPVTALRRAHHLSIITDPLKLADTILDLTRTLRPQTHPTAAH
jgi:Alpha/beta hydrolase family